jgi:uncharacterized peroxidase-related enzyme
VESAGRELIGRSVNFIGRSVVLRRGRKFIVSPTANAGQLTLIGRNTMSHVQLQTASSAQGDSKALLEQINGAFGVTPAMFRAVANSPAALKSMWGSFGALSASKLGGKLGELLAVAIANRNACEYCLAAHAALGRKAGATPQEVTDAQVGASTDVRTAAALKFALKVVDARGQVTDADVAAIRHAGFDDESIVEIIAHVALNLFTNYINVALNVPVDFPAVKLKSAA